MKKMKFRIIIGLVVLLLLCVVPITALAENADTPAAEPADAQPQETVPEEAPPALVEPISESSVPTLSDPEVLIIDLGPEWAGVEFSLTMDVGDYPGTIVVDESGLLATELGDSKAYKLTRLTSGNAAPLQEATADGEDTKPTTVAETERIDEQPTATATEEHEAVEQEDIPTLHLVLFFGGLAICVASLIGLRIARIKRYAREASNDYDDDDED